MLGVQWLIASGWGHHMHVLCQSKKLEVLRQVGLVTGNHMQALADVPSEEVDLACKRLVLKAHQITQ